MFELEDDTCEASVSPNSLCEQSYVLWSELRAGKRDPRSGELLDVCPGVRSECV